MDDAQPAAHDTASTGDHRRSRPRITHDLGLPGTPGALDAVVDVPGIRVGHCTVVEGESIRTGVTALVPDAVCTVDGRLPAGLAVGNGFGKLIGATQVVELGEIETPVLLTATLSAYKTADALVSWMLGRPGNENLRTLNPVVGETNDGWLSDIRARPVSEADVRHALEVATADACPSGCVGAGTGTVALGWKGGIGTASRKVTLRDERHGTVGALVQSNFSGTLTVRGAQVPGPVGSREPEPGSCMILLATDLPLDARQLTRVAQRGLFAMGRVGAAYTHGSGDYALAISTQPLSTAGDAAPVADGYLDPVFTAAQDAVEAALLDSVCSAVDTVGFDGHRAPAVPHERILAAAEAPRSW